MPEKFIPFSPNLVAAGHIKPKEWAPKSQNYQLQVSQEEAGADTEMIKSSHQMAPTDNATSSGLTIQAVMPQL